MAASAMSARINGPTQPATPRRFASIDDLVRRVGLRRDEIRVLAEVGALNSFGMDRRSALWQVERVIRPAGELFEGSVTKVRSDRRTVLRTMSRPKTVQPETEPPATGNRRPHRERAIAACADDARASASWLTTPAPA